jgi:hypothetical protein
MHPSRRFPTASARLLLVAVAALLSTSTAAAAQEFELEPGFVSLYNGKDLSGWAYRAKKTRVVTDDFEGKAESKDGRFSAKGELLVANPRPEGGERGKLYTTREFPGDFELRFEFRASEYADSGVYLRKPQLQVRDYLSAGPYRTLTQYQPQKWNEIVVVVKNDVATVTCNGEILEERMELPASGPIGIESDRGTLEYRRLRVKELP